ncbi:hypothetical protein ANTPLA_LOCUS5918 [Anthophora plagiata]
MAEARFNLGSVYLPCLANHALTGLTGVETFRDWTTSTRLFSYRAAGCYPDTGGTSGRRVNIREFMRGTSGVCLKTCTSICPEAPGTEPGTTSKPVANNCPSEIALNTLVTGV